MPRHIGIFCLQGGESFRRHFGIGEETAHTAQLLDIGQFLRPQIHHKIGDFLRTGYFTPRKSLVQSLIGKIGRSLGAQIQHHRPHYIAVLSLEAAVTIGIIAFRHGKYQKLSAFRIEYLHRVDTLTDFGSVGTHILHHRTAHRAGNAG